MGINLKQLAAELKLSTSTVSRALHDSHEISIETKQRVREMAEKLSYQPNPYASSLRKQKSKTIALVIPEIDNNFFTLAINGIEEVAQKKSYHVLIYLTHEDLKKEVAIAKHLLSGRVDGILISVTSQTEDIEHLKNLYDTGIPLVFFDRICEQIDTAKITTDDYDSGYKATRHLLEAGCKRIAYLQVSETLSISKKRFAGFQNALLEQHIKTEPGLILTCSGTEEENHQQIKNLLQSANPPDGIFASVEKLAVTSYLVCNELNLNIPEKIKLISFSNLATAPLLSPSLSTITQPAFDIGKKCAEVLFNIIERRAMEDSKATTVLKSSLIARNSTK
ncbi:LacI family DNA-binding transcriptional regulator [Pedobacter nutrimenti]|jgi:LacI family transcriptional regulator|uniref:LacI family transcriptional regulator n=1 Tax=Pedobacter nutrimenti TaxID=1241337 RepID=A0A318UGS1_9SPHI|nr:LacI family DNA-binding transcriptional regulator [Pedobacter nutrimenti]PYF71577.1 LacI family transcriptional regulator [Pedobacter nutrimenti]|eukprot:gene17620-21016_t